MSNYLVGYALKTFSFSPPPSVPLKPMISVDGHIEIESTKEGLLMELSLDLFRIDNSESYLRDYQGK